MRRTLLALTCLVLALATVAADAARRAPAPAAPPSVTATTFVVSGRGWGHGVGLEPVRGARLRERGLDVRPDHRALLSGHRARAGAGRPRARADRRVEAEADDRVALAVPRAGRLREDLSARRRLALARPEAARDRQRRSRPSSPGPSLFLPGTTPLELGGALPRPARGRRHRAEAVRDQHRRRRAVPRRRRGAGDAQRVARAGAARRRRSPRARTRSPTARAARRSTSTPTYAARSTAASRPRRRA